MKKMLSKFANKVANTYGIMTSNASMALFFGQTKAPKSLIKNN